MTPEEINTDKRLYEKITPEAWFVEHIPGDIMRNVAIEANGHRYYIAKGVGLANATFMVRAHARWPAYIAEVERLTALVKIQDELSSMYTELHQKAYEKEREKTQWLRDALLAIELLDLPTDKLKLLAKLALRGEPENTK